MASLSTINNCKHAKKNSVQCDFNYSQISKTSLIAKILSTHLLITLIYYITHSQGCPEGFAGGGRYGLIDQLFDQFLQFDQLNWHLYDADLVGQTVKIGQKVGISLKMHSYHENYTINSV